MLFRCVHQRHHHAVISLRRDVRVDQTGQLDKFRIVGVPKAIHLQRVYIESRMEVFVVQNDGVEIDVQRSEDFSGESLCRDLAHLQCGDGHVLHQRSVVLLPLGAPEPGYHSIIFLKIQRIQQQVIRDAGDVAHREFDIHVHVICRIDEGLVHEALIVEVSGIDGHPHIVEDHELISAVVCMARGVTLAHEVLFDVEEPMSIGRDASDLQLVALIRSGGYIHLQIRLVLVPSAISIQPIGGTVITHDLYPEGETDGMRPAGHRGAGAAT